MKTLGMVTIGQAPRDDVVPEMEKLLGPEIRVIQAGALDGLADAEIAPLVPAAGQEALTTRLADGRSVIVAKPAILARLQGCLDRLAPRVDASVILCTGTFPRWRSARPVLEPDRILAAATRAVFDDGHLGVLIPIAEQREGAVARWSPIAARLTVAVASPYRETADLIAAGEALARAGATLVVMSCMGYTAAMKALVRDVTGAPVLLPTSLLARLAAEVL